MSQEAAFDNMADVVNNVLGISATFIPTVGDNLTLNVHFDQRVAEVPEAFAGRVTAYLREIEFLYADLGRLPDAGEEFKIGSNYYTVEWISEHEQSGRFVKAVVKLDNK